MGTRSPKDGVPRLRRRRDDGGHLLWRDHTLLSEASADLEALGEGERPKGGDGEVLSDTSGGVSAGAMVGVAGLALAASLLVVVRLVRTG